MLHLPGCQGVDHGRKQQAGRQHSPGRMLAQDRDQHVVRSGMPWNVDTRVCGDPRHMIKAGSLLGSKKPLPCHRPQPQAHACYLAWSQHGSFWNSDRFFPPPRGSATWPQWPPMRTGNTKAFF